MPAWALRSFAEARGLLASGADTESSGDLDPAVQDALAAIFADPGGSDVLAPELFALMERLRVEFQEQSNPQRALTLLAKLRYTLARLEPERMSEAQKRQVRSEAAAIQAQMTLLLGDSIPPAAADTGLAGRVARLFGGR